MVRKAAEPRRSLMSPAPDPSWDKTGKTVLGSLEVNFVFDQPRSSGLYTLNAVVER